MKLIIDIPDEYYKKDNLIHFFGCYSEKLDEVIKNGIPLPKDPRELIYESDFIPYHDYENGICFAASYYEPQESEVGDEV